MAALKAKDHYEHLKEEAEGHKASADQLWSRAKKVGSLWYSVIGSSSGRL